VIGEREVLAILCGGGPAPGMNSVISSATIDAINSGWKVLGILDGFKHLIKGSTDAVIELSIERVSRIQFDGGTILFTARANPTVREEGAADPEWRLQSCVKALKSLSVSALLTIGGDDTAFSATRIAEKSGGAFRVVHVPKTIDNDLPLPGMIPTFGFETARQWGSELVKNLLVDATASKRWFFVVAMGRSAGHLALGMGKAGSATLTIIAEEFQGKEPIGLNHLCDIVETTMLKRSVVGRPFGVVVLAEGLGLRLREEELEAQGVKDVERDEHGHIRLSELPLDRVLADVVRARFKMRKQSPTIVGKNIGYELRCAPPVAFDIDYTRDLGFGAVEYLKSLIASRSSEVGGMITLQGGKLVPLRFGSFNDPITGRPKVRGVDVSSDSFRSARGFMIRLEEADLKDPARLAALAKEAQMSEEAFTARYAYLVAGDGR